MSFVVAVDGPAAAGKGTISKALAATFGFRHLDTGLLYRATARRVLDGLEPLQAAEALIPEDLDRGDLREPDVAAMASSVAADERVRAALVRFQREFVEAHEAVVLDGRDIGTVICPEAAVKLYVTASDEVRARRRQMELAANGFQRTEAEVLEDLRARDRRDSERATSPLRPADDAVVLDTTTMTIADAVAVAVDHVNAARR